jgi:hypothetical protein
MRKTSNIDNTDNGAKGNFIKKSESEKSAQVYRELSNTELKTIYKTVNFENLSKKESTFAENGKPPTPKHVQRKSSNESKNDNQIDKIINLYTKIHKIRVISNDKKKERNYLSSLLEENILKENEAISKNEFELAHEIEKIVCDTKNKLDKINIELECLDNDLNNLRESEIVTIRHKTKQIEELLNINKKNISSKESELKHCEQSSHDKEKTDTFKIMKMKEKLEILQTNLNVEKEVIIY